MKLGAMNNPSCDLLGEIERIAAAGFDFIDLTLEPSKARSDQISVTAVKEAIRSTGIGVIGHTAYYLPIASPFDSLRESAVQEVEHCLRVFHELGITSVNVHPQNHVPLHSEEWVRERNVESIARLAALARSLGQTLLFENFPGAWSRAAFLKPVFEALPDLRFHLDVGHAHLDGPENRTAELLEAFGAITEHVHLSDNFGGHEDLHLPIGAGSIDWGEIVSLLKGAGYDGTITLEVFSRDVDYLYLSRDKVREMWMED